MRTRILSYGVAILFMLVLSETTHFAIRSSTSAEASAAVVTANQPAMRTEPAVFRDTRSTVKRPSSPQFGPASPIGFVLDDGYAETSLGFGNFTYNYSAAAIWLNGFSVPDSVPYPLTLTGVQIAYPGLESCNCVGKQIRVLVYLDTDRNGDPSNAGLIYQSSQIITVADWDTFQYFPMNLVVNTHGDLYVGWEDMWAESGPSPLEYVAAIDTTLPHHRSWLIAKTYCCSPNISNLAANDYRHLTDYVSPSNLMVRLLADSYTPASPTPLPTNTPLPTATPIPPRCPGERFTDVCPGDYFYEPVLSLNDEGIVSGYNTSPPCLTPAHIPCYLPYNNVTRGQTSKIVSLAAGFTEPVSGQLFEDIPPGSTFYTYIQQLASRGIINGYPCGGRVSEPCIPPGNRPYFRPNNSVTRGQLSKMTSEAFGYADQVSGQSFEDVPAGSTFYAYIERMVERAIINGYPCGSGGEPCIPPGNRPYFRPNNPVTRGQTAKILYIARSLVTPTPTVTRTAIPTATNTYVPSSTDTPTETQTSLPSATGTPTEASITATVTATDTPAARR